MNADPAARRRKWFPGILAAPWIALSAVALFIAAVYGACSNWRQSIGKTWEMAVGLEIWSLLALAAVICGVSTLLLLRLRGGASALAVGALVLLESGVPYLLVPKMMPVYRQYGADLPTPTLLVVDSYVYAPLAAILGFVLCTLWTLGRARGTAFHRGVRTALIGLAVFASAALPLLLLSLTLPAMPCGCGCGAI